MKFKKSMLLTILATMTFSLSSQATEELKYSIVTEDKRIEVRDYESYVTASVSYDSKDLYDKKAFRTLFRYISGNNTLSQNIDMTAPVIINDSTKIPMTAPVIINQNEEDSIFQMSFVLPSEFTYESAPKPLNREVILKEIQKSLKATIRFNGFMTKRAIEKNTRKLTSWIKNDGRFSIISKPVLAGYNSPMTLPFLRRNEIIIEVEYK